jgi:hypothetical protein
MPNREYEPVRREDGNQGFRGRDERDERELGMRDERWGQGQGWQGRNQERGGWGNEERWSPDRYGRSWDERMRNLSGMGGYDRFGGMERGYGGPYYGDDRWGRGFNDERWGRSGEERWNRGYPDDRWGRRYEDMRQHPFGFGGMDRGFGGGGYGGYGRDPYSSGGGYWANEGGFQPGRYGSQDYGPGDRGYGMQRGYRADMPGYGQGERRPMGRAPRSYMRSDERIKEDLCDRLMQSWIDAEDVDVQVTKGEVMLGGTVRDRAAKRAIEDMAEQILGVKDVQNHIRVQERHHEPQHGTQQQTATGSTRKPSA